MEIKMLLLVAIKLLILMYLYQNMWFTLLLSILITFKLREESKISKI